MKISVIIPTRNRPVDLKRCIDSILIQSVLPDELIIVDSSDVEQGRVRDAVDCYRDKIKIIYLQSAPGLTHQKNVGAEFSSGDILFFIDDDMILETHFIKEVMNIFQQDHKGIVGGVCGEFPRPQIDKHSPQRFLLKTFYSLVGTTIDTVFGLPRPGNGKILASGFATRLINAKKVTEVEIISAGFSGWRKAIVAQLKFDESLHGYCMMEDVDFSYRVSRKYINVHNPFAKGIHNISPVNRLDTKMEGKMFIENSYYLFKKNIPQTIDHKLAYSWALVGISLTAILNTVRSRNTAHIKGVVSGLTNIRKKK